MESDLALPCDARCRSRALDPRRDVLRVQRRSLQDFPCAMRRVRRQLSYDVGNGVLIETAEFLMHIGQGGRTITVDADEQHQALAALWLLGAGLSTSAFFRGELPLRGAAVQLDGQMVGILGPSGAGKSTLVWALLQGGALFGNDGLLPLRFEDSHEGWQESRQEGESKGAQVTAIPAISLHPRLPRATMRRRRLALKQYDPVLARRSASGVSGPASGPDEFWLPIEPLRHATEPAQLAALFVLRPGTTADASNAWADAAPDIPPDVSPDVSPFVRPLSQEAANLLVQSSVAGWSFVRKQVSEAQLASRCLALARCVPAYAIEYPKTFGMTTKVAQAIRRTLSAHPPLAHPPLAHRDARESPSGALGRG